MLPSDYTDTFLESPNQVGLDEGIGDSRIFRDLEYAFCLQHIKKYSKVLDIGASQSWFLLELTCRNCTVTTVDINPEAMSFQKQMGINCKQANLTKLPFEKDEFSIVTCISTIEHVHGDDDIQGMKEIRRVSPKAIITLPMGREINWKPHDPKKERRYNIKLLKERILPGYRICRKAEIKVWDSAIRQWLSEQCFYLERC